MPLDNWILNDKREPVAEPDLLAWAKWFGDHNAERVVARTEIGASRVSTVFLGLDHNFARRGAPILWETMVFGGRLDQEQDRCSGSWQDAEAMHKKMCARVVQCN